MDTRETDQRLDIFGIEYQGARSKNPRACAKYFGVGPLFAQAIP